jgi:membrane-bound lytic murein transglycosylase A
MVAMCLSGCGMLKKKPSRPAVTTSTAQVDEGITVQADGTTVWQRSKSRWVQTTWEALPGWQQDQPSQAWSALWQSCQRPTPDWRAMCQRVRVLGAGWGMQVGDATVQMWLQAHLTPWRIESNDGEATGLLTGYFEPIVEARRQPDARFRSPLYRPPADLGQRKPWYSRADMDNLPQAMAALQGRALAYVADPLDALLIQVQGSTRLRMLDDIQADGQPRMTRLAFAGHNDHPYQSVARWLVDQGEMSMNQASWPAIKAWANANPARVSQMLQANPRVVFFKEEALVRTDQGPNGAQGVPLTPQRSIAVDKDSMPYGSLVWLDSSSPLGTTPLQRLVVAQDTGSAIVGAIRADYFWGWGDEALAQAGRTKQPLRMWVLWPLQ